VNTNCFHIVKIYSHNNNRDTKVNLSKIRNGGESVEISKTSVIFWHLHFQMITPTVSLITVVEFWIALYKSDISYRHAPFLLWSLAAWGLLAIAEGSFVTGSVLTGAIACCLHWNRNVPTQAILFVPVNLSRMSWCEAPSKNYNGNAAFHFQRGKLHRMKSTITLMSLSVPHHCLVNFNNVKYRIT
jgi:hypothetical protein